MFKKQKLLLVLFVLALMGSFNIASAQFGAYGSPELLSSLDQNTPNLYRSPDQVYSYYPNTANPNVNYQNAAYTNAGYPNPTVQAVSPVSPYPIRSVSQPGAGHFIGGVNGAPVSPSPQFGQMMDPQPQGSGLDCCQGDACGECCDSIPYCCPPPCSLWYAYVGAVGMTRDSPNRVWTSYETDCEPNQIMNTCDADMQWLWGGEVRLGRSFCCDAFTIEGGYWWLNQKTEESSITNPNGVSTPLNMSYLVVGPDAQLMTCLFDNAAEHRLWRSNEVHSVEVNFIGGGPQNRWCGWRPRFLTGVRFFRFEEDLLFGSLAGGATSWGPDQAEDQGYLRDKVTNNLVGWQFGFLLESPEYHRLQFISAVKFGIFNNYTENHFDLYRGDGYRAYSQEESGMSVSYPINSSNNFFSTLAEIDLGIQWNFSRCVSAVIGYRLVAVSGICLSDNQIPPYIIDEPEIRRIDNNGDLFLHGAFGGLTVRF
jgi:putative beta barrel porin BBP7